jgi:hypothetical protein
VSEARATLASLKEMESKYLIEREKKSIEIIDKVLAESVSILNEAKDNYSQIISLYNTVNEFSIFLKSEYESFKLLISNFDEQNKLWNSQISEREKVIDNLKIEINCDRIRIKNDSESIVRDKERIAIDRIKLNDERGVVERMIERLKLNRI